MSTEQWGQLCVLPDANLFHLLIDQNLDINDLENIELLVAPFVVVDTVRDELTEKLESLDLPARTVWDHAVWHRNQRYENLLRANRRDPFDSLKEINRIRDWALPMLHSFVPSLSDADAFLLASSFWIRSRTNVEPIIVAEDRGILFACHVLSSYIGMSVGVHSIFELMRLTGLQDYVGAYSDGYRTPFPRVSLPSDQSRDGIVRDVEIMLKRGKLGTHPQLSARDGIRRITPRDRS
ncbi:MAG: hypothetical protein ABR867_00660 [Nitrososphaerales archaeon]